MLANFSHSPTLTRHVAPLPGQPAPQTTAQAATLTSGPNSSKAASPTDLQVSQLQGHASVLPLPDHCPTIRARLPFANPAPVTAPVPAPVDRPVPHSQTAMPVASEPSLVVLAPRAIDPELYAQLPTHEAAAAVNQRWLAMQTEPVVDDAKRREADKLIDGLLEQHQLSGVEVDRHALQQACLSGINIHYAIRVSKRLDCNELPLNAGEIAGCATAGLKGVRGARIVRLYRAAGLALRADTAPVIWKKGALASMRFLREGTYNKTSILNIEGKRYVFKPDPGKVSPSHLKAPAFAPGMNCSANNLAASRLDEALGWKTICKIRLAAGEHDGKLRLGILMDFVRGQAVARGTWHEMDTNSQTQMEAALNRLGLPGSLQRKQAWISRLVSDHMVGISEDEGVMLVLPDYSTREMTEMTASRSDIIVSMLRKQAVDWIIGDLDSSAGNYLYDSINGTITSFDKDFTFTTRAAFEDNYCWEGDVPAFWRNMGVPPFLDHASYADVSRLRDRLPELLSGLVAPEAIRACRARINSLLCFTRNASVDELAVMDWSKPPQAGSLNGSTLLWRDVYRFG